MDTLKMILAVLGSNVATAWTTNYFNRRKYKAEAESAEVDSSVKINREWENIFNKQKEEFETFKDDIKKEMHGRDLQLDELTKEVKRLTLELEECRNKIG